MPTQRRRYTITETDAIERALAGSRASADPSARDSQLLTELIVLGAEAKAVRGEQELAERERRERLLRRFVRRGGIDQEALDEVRRSGLTRDA